MVTIRAYSRPDAERIVAFSLAAWSPVFESFRAVLGMALFDRVHGDWRTRQAAAVAQALEHHETWVSLERDVVTGFVSVKFDAADKSGEIYMMAVDPAYQRRGTATALTEHALSAMRRRGLDLAIVATGGDPGHAGARATYQRAGFVACPQVWYAKLL
jgi:ribosomal protein S18 acetylase RimI-like enzyme